MQAYYSGPVLISMRLLSSAEKKLRDYLLGFAMVGSKKGHSVGAPLLLEHHMASRALITPRPSGLTRSVTGRQRPIMLGPLVLQSIRHIFSSSPEVRSERRRSRLV